MFRAKPGATPLYTALSSRSACGKQDPGMFAEVDNRNRKEPRNSVTKPQPSESLPINLLKKKLKTHVPISQIFKLIPKNFHHEDALFSLQYCFKCSFVTTVEQRFYLIPFLGNVCCATSLAMLVLIVQSLSQGRLLVYQKNIGLQFSNNIKALIDLPKSLCHFSIDFKFSNRSGFAVSILPGWSKVAPPFLKLRFTLQGVALRSCAFCSHVWS